jgi:hypothetical protein
VNIITWKDGMDFYFPDRQHANRFIDFLESKVPANSKYSRKLVTADHVSNVGHYKHNYLVEIAAPCKDDLVVIPLKLAKNLSDFNPLCLIKGVGAGLHFVDPLTCEKQECNMEKYLRDQFKPVMTPAQAIRFVILSADPMILPPRPSAKARGGQDRRARLAECVVVREKDLGVNDVQLTAITHLGRLVKAGDVFLGYDLTQAAWVQEHWIAQGSKSHKRGIPDVVLVRKMYHKKGERNWVLKGLEDDFGDIEHRQEAAGAGSGPGPEPAGKGRKSNARVGHGQRRQLDTEMEDLEEFMQELETDKDMRATVNLYKRPGQLPQSHKASAAAAAEAALSRFPKPSDSSRKAFGSAKAFLNQGPQGPNREGAEQEKEEEEDNQPARVGVGLGAQMRRAYEADEDDEDNDENANADSDDDLQSATGSDDDDDDDDDEAVKLEELLDELDVDGGGATDKFVPDANLVLTAAAAAAQPELEYENSSFDASNYDEKDFKFT